MMDVAFLCKYLQPSTHSWCCSSHPVEHRNTNCANNTLLILGHTTSDLCPYGTWSSPWVALVVVNKCLLEKYQVSQRELTVTFGKAHLALARPPNFYYIN